MAWFVAADVCRALRIGNVSDAVAGLDNDEKITLATIEGDRGGPDRLGISESGLYALIPRSRKPAVVKFRR